MILIQVVHISEHQFIIYILFIIVQRECYGINNKIKIPITYLYN